MKYRSTFFPANWSREKVVDAIFEAYDEFVKSGRALQVNRSDKIIMRGILKDSTKIEICLTKKGRIKTAYPILD